MDILEQIKALPPELREKIVKEHRKTKHREREEMGWGNVIYSLICVPFCEKDHQLVKVIRIDNYYFNDGKKYLCSLCLRKGRRHYLDEQMDDDDF